MWLRFFPTAATACYLLVEVAVTRPVAGFLTRLKVPMQSGTDVPQYHRLSFNPGIAADATEAVTQNEDLNAAAVPSRMLLQQQRSVFLPLLVSWSTSCNHTTPEDDVSTLFTNAMNELAQQSPNVFVVQTTIKDALHHHDWMWTCDMPALGDNYRLSLRRSFDLVESKQQPQQQQDGLVLTLEGNNLRDSDWQWVCHQVYNQLQGHNSNNNTTTTSAFHRIVSTVELRQILAVHYNRLPACPGLDAASAAWSTLQSLSFEPALLLNRHIVRNQNSNKDAPTLSERDAAMVDLWQTLQTQGYVVIDDFSRHRMLSKSENDRKDRYPIVSLATTSTQQQALSAYLRETTGQGSLVRTDRVHFLSREQAVACDVVTQYDFCMGLAHWFNRNVGNHRPGPTPEHPHDDGMRPMAPATDQAPFTIPHNLQFAEYGPGDFYTVRTRLHFLSRFVTCNSPWCCFLSDDRRIATTL